MGAHSAHPEAILPHRRRETSLRGRARWRCSLPTAPPSSAGAVSCSTLAPERFRGEHEPVDPVAGHIPGARNHPMALNVDAAGRFRDAATLRETFAQVGVRAGAGIGVYCGSGVCAAHEVFALELAGIAAALYPGSWSEWIADSAGPLGDLLVTGQLKLSRNASRACGWRSAACWRCRSPRRSCGEPWRARRSASCTWG